MGSIKFELVTLDGVKNRGDVYEVILPTPLGYIGVFENHSPLVGVASPGVISVRKNRGDPDDLMDYYATSGGVIEIANNEVKVLVDDADHADEINEKEINEAHQRALKLRAEAKDQISLDHAQSLIDRYSVRIKVASIKRRKH